MEQFLYSERDIKQQGEHYLRHIDRMTAEDLHSKSDIAAELAHRDIEIESLRAQLAALHRVDELNDMAARVVAMCKKRGWSLHWTHRGAYLHLESSELIEAIRGKHGDPGDEAGDVLLVLMSITEYAGIPFSKVIEHAINKLFYLENSPPYPREEREEVKQQEIAHDG